MNNFQKNRSIKGFQSYKIGLETEQMAIQYMLNNGYSILAHRHKTPYGEIDLIVENNDWLLAIEVKYRKSISNSIESITTQQAQRLLNALEYSLLINPSWIKENIRYDLLAYDKNKKIKHIKDIIRKL